MRVFIYSLMGLSVLMIQSCSEKKDKPVALEAAKKQTKNAALKWTTVLSAQPQFVITLPGELEPYEQVSVYPKIKGFVKKIYVDRGSHVRKGQLLAMLEAPEVGSMYAASRSSSNTAYQKLLFSRQSYYRLKEAARKNGAVATIELERAYAQYLGDSAAYSSSRSETSATGQMQAYLRITAPFNGVVTGRFVSEGALVGENGVNGEPLFQLAQQENLRLTVAIPEKQAQSLPAGTKASFTVVDLPGKIFTAILSRNSGALDVKSRSLIAEFDVANAGTELRAGQYAKVSINLQRPQPTLWLPSTSVVQAQSGVFVIKKENGSTKRIPVQMGVVKDSLVEVFGDLGVGDDVLLKGSEEIKEGMKIGK